MVLESPSISYTLRKLFLHILILYSPFTFVEFNSRSQKHYVCASVCIQKGILQYVWAGVCSSGRAGAFCILFGARDWAQSFVHAGQALCHWATSPAFMECGLHSVVLHSWKSSDYYNWPWGYFNDRWFNVFFCFVRMKIEPLSLHCPTSLPLFILRWRLDY